MTTTPTNTLTRSEKLDLLAAWSTQYTNADVATNQLTDLFGDITESKLNRTIWQMFDAHTDALSLLLGDIATALTSTWLHWFCYDNDMGARGFQAGHNGQLKTIKTFEDLLDLIEGGTQHKAAAQP
jgi:hypothetical protein